MAPTPQTPLDLFDTDALIDEEDRAIRDTVRRFVDERIRPHLAELVRGRRRPGPRPRPELGTLGAARHAPRGLRLRRHQRHGVRAGLHGARGRRLRAALAWSRCRARWRCSRSGSTAARSRSSEWLPRMAAGRGDRLLRAHRAGLRLQPRRACAPGRASATATTGCSTAPRCGSPTARSPTSPSSGPRTDDGGSAGSSCRPTRRASPRPRSSTRCRCAPRSPAELVLDDVRLPAVGDAARGDAGCRGPLSLPHRGAVRHRLRLARRGPRLPRDRDRLRAASREIFDKPLAAYQLTQAKLADMTRRAGQGDAARAAPRPAQGRGHGCRPSRSASASSTTSARRSRSPASAARSSAPPGSRWSTRSCGTPTTSSRC